MKKQFSILALLFLMSIVSLSFGQFYELSRFADNNGLPTRIVRGVFQDNEGFLWVAGNNGLFRFDTKQFKSYYSALKDTTGLRGNKINIVTQSSDNKVWVGTDKGLHYIENDHIIYKQLLENPKDDENYILSIYEDKDQNLWVGTYGGLFVIEKSTDSIFVISKINNNIPKVTVWGITQTADEKILFTIDNKVYVSDQNKKFIFHKLKLSFNDGIRLEKTNLFNIKEFGKNFFLIGSSSGLLKGVLSKENILTINKFKTEKGEPIATYFIEDFLIDSDKNIWIATWQNYFKKYKLINNELVRQDVFIKNGLLNMSSNILSIYEDFQKNIWISNTNGLFKLSEDKGNIFIFPPSHIENCFSGFSVNALVEDKGKHLWIANNKGLYRFKKLDILNRNCPKDYLFFENSQFNSIHSLFIDSKNRLWVSGKGGISIAQLDNNYSPGKFFTITKKNGLPHNWSFDIHEEDEKNYWSANYIGLLKISFKNEELNKPKIKRYDSSQNRSDALVNSFVLDLQKDANNNVWIGTFNGLSKLISEEETGIFNNYTSTFGNYNHISNNSIKKIFVDKNRRLWVGTQIGLNLYRENTDDFIQFGKNDGLPSEYILGLQEDSKGFLYVATTNGIMKARYKDSTNSFTEFQYYSHEDGLADNITNKNAILIDDEDNVFIGSSKGLSVYTNSKITPELKKKNFNLALISLKTSQSGKQGFASVKRKIKNNKIELSHFENSIQLQYAALDFTNFKYNKYRHKFLPVNNNWIETENISELTYYNISPGEYELILDGSNNNGIWSDNPIHLKIIISPPFWKSNFALIFYALIVIGIIRFFHILKIRKKRKELTQEINLKKALINEREQLRQENTADFHDELGSKVTKVSLYLTLAERSLQNKEDTTKWLSKIRTNINDISDTFRDLLWVIDPKKDTLSDTLLRLKDFGENLFNNTEITFRTSGFSFDKTNYMLDPQTKKQIVLIFKEAMNNCIKYSKCKTVTLNLISSELYSTLELIDDGIGFDPKMETNGRGLKNMMNRAKKMNVDLNVFSTLKKGTTIRLCNIPHMMDDFSSEDE